MISAASEVAFLSRALKAPRLPEPARVLAQRARQEAWDYEAYLAAVLTEEVTHGGQARVKPARFPQIKTLDDFDFGFQRSVKRTQIAHLAQLDLLAEARNVVFLAHREPAKHISRSPWACRPHDGDIGWLSPPRMSGWCDWASLSGRDD